MRFHILALIGVIAIASVIPSAESISQADNRYAQLALAEVCEDEGTQIATSTLDLLAGLSG